MSDPAEIHIEARVHERERPGMAEAAEQLHECLSRASGGQPAFRVKLAFAVPGQAPARVSRSTLVVLSLLPELDCPGDAIDDTGRRWLRDLQALADTGAPVYVRNIFRHVPERTRDGRPTPLLERIRRLNRMAVALSNQTGAAVIDVDRAFAEIGGRDLRTDYRMQGPVAAALSGHATVLSFLSFGMDAIVEPDLQERARSSHGGLREARAFIQKRFSSR